jgi:hypothetical protein
VNECEPNTSPLNTGDPRGKRLAEFDDRAVPETEHTDEELEGPFDVRESDAVMVETLKHESHFPSLCRTIAPKGLSPKGP